MGLKSLSVVGSNPPGSTKRGYSTTVSAPACHAGDGSSILLTRSSKTNDLSPENVGSSGMTRVRFIKSKYVNGSTRSNVEGWDEKLNDRFKRQNPDYSSFCNIVM